MQKEGRITGRWWRWSNNGALVPARIHIVLEGPLELSAAPQKTISTDYSNFPDHPPLSGPDKWTRREWTVPVAHAFGSPCVPAQPRDAAILHQGNKGSVERDQESQTVLSVLRGI